MVLTLIIVLYVSIAGMVLLIGIKRFELKTGRVLASSVRPALARVSHSTVLWGKQFPYFVGRYFIQKTPVARVALQRMLARGLVWTEHLLEQMLHTLRRGTTPQKGGTPVSDFLREVTEHKRTLLRTVHRTKEKK